MKLFCKYFCKKPRRCVLPALIIMQVDISFQFAKVYDIERADVVLGQKFSLLTDYDGNSKWFADNDAVLKIDQAGNNADIEATALGSSTVLIMDTSLNIIKKLTIRIVDAIVEPAADLGLTADPAVAKS